MSNVAVIKQESEECVVIPITLLMDLYAEVRDRKDLTDRVKAIFKGQK